MAQPAAKTISKPQVDALRGEAQEAFAKILQELHGRLSETPRFFASGVELVEVTLKIGNNIEFSVTVAGKDAPKTQGSSSISA